MDVLQLRNYGRRWTWWLLLVGLASHSILSCQQQPLRRCPAGSFAHPQRVQQLEKYHALQRGEMVCWGKWPFSVVDQHGRFLLRQQLTAKQAAARVAHLQHHRGKSPSQSADCLAWWITEESQAMALELRLLRQWKGSADRFAYAELYYQLPREKGIKAIADFIYAHPHGAAGMDALLLGYQKRCKVP